MNIGVAEIMRRYPDEGYAINHKCSEMGYVIKGSGKLLQRLLKLTFPLAMSSIFPMGKNTIGREI